MARVVIIGSGFAGLAAACCLAQAGMTVTILEKNEHLGGRARVWRQDGFTFDMGPSWYWMPDIFEEFFARFGKTPADYYDLVRLDPSYRVYFGKDDLVDLPASRTELRALFETIEPGVGTTLKTFLDQAAYKYRVGIGDYVRRPSLSLTEFVDVRMVYESFRIQMLQSMDRHLRRYFKSERLRRITEFPVLFLGGTASEIPAMYSLMNYADIVGGTWYPMGGMGKVVDALVALAQSLGVTLLTNAEARRIVVENGIAQGVETNDAFFPADCVIAGADYHHVEQGLVAPEWRQYTESYWDSRVLSPSSLLFYLGIGKKLASLQHHNLFLDEGLTEHAREIYQTPRWPTRPLFYVCCPSQTDLTVAPPDCENLFILIPVAPGLTDTPETRDRYFTLVLDRLERLTGQAIRDAILVQRNYAHQDFISDYHAYKGNAYGLANTLSQTAIFKPRLQSARVPNLYYCGQLTVPGPGVPPALLSGQIVSSLVLSHL